MNTFNNDTILTASTLADRLNAFAEAGIDPAFDFECEELERQFAEFRLTLNQQ